MTWLDLPITKSPSIVWNQAVSACSPEEMAGPATCEKDRYAKTMRELARRPDPRTASFCDPRPKTENVMPSSVNEEKKLEKRASREILF
jgi:hypothetical protein